MLINDFSKIIKIVPQKMNYKFMIFIFLLLISSALELISISALIPIAEVLIGGKTSFEFVNVFLSNISGFFAKSVDVYFILSLFLIIIITKTVFLIFFSYWTNKF